MRKGAINKALAKNVTNNGTVLSTRELVEKKVAEGAKVEVSKSGERRLTAPDGSFLREAQISKTGMDYAGHLASRKVPTIGDKSAPPFIKAKAEIPPGTAKEPWQMSKEEVRKTPPLYGKTPAWRTLSKSLVANATLEEAHKASIEKAISEGKSIPPENLKEYGLTPRPGPGAKTEAASSPAKEPWQMGREEFINAVRKGYDFKQLGVNPTPLSALRAAKDWESLDRQARTQHEAAVTMAHVNQKPIPKDVLRQYPELDQLERKRQATASSTTRHGPGAKTEGAKGKEAPLITDFRNQPAHQAVKAWESATPAEKEKLRPWLVNKYQGLESYSPPERRQIKAAIGKSLKNME
jgi:hypothetical protein